MSENDPRLAWLEDETGRRITLREHFAVGRAPANSLALQDPEQRVSSYHARFECDASGRYVLEDRHSTNGTFVNERKITRRELLHGDRIRFGSKAVFAFHHPASATPTAVMPDALDVTMRHYEERDCWFVIGDMKGSSQLARTLDGIALARLVTDWAARVRDLAEQHGGAMANRTGDGWLLLWVGGASVAQSVADTLRKLQVLQRATSPEFRVVVHRGRATLAGGVRAGEDNVLSAELHQAFRMEKIASKLGQDMVASEAAVALLQSVLPCEPLPGAFELPGFAGEHRFFRVG